MDQCVCFFVGDSHQKDSKMPDSMLLPLLFLHEIPKCEMQLDCTPPLFLPNPKTNMEKTKNSRSNYMENWILSPSIQTQSTKTIEENKLKKKSTQQKQEKLFRIRRTSLWRVSPVFFYVFIVLLCCSCFLFLSFPASYICLSQSFVALCLMTSLSCRSH